MIDLSGTPRSDQDLQDAIDTVIKEFHSKRPVMNHEMMLVFPTIMDCLTELQGFRKPAATAWSIISPVGRLCYRYIGPHKHLLLKQFKLANKSLDNLKDYQAVEVMICLKESTSPSDS